MISRQAFSAGHADKHIVRDPEWAKPRELSLPQFLHGQGKPIYNLLIKSLQYLLVTRRSGVQKPLSLSAKLLLFGAGALAFVAGPILFLFPTQTEAYFAWTINHPLTPVFMGANYLGGLGALW